MALTRKFLSALGIEAEKQDEIINAHTETVDGLKDQLAKVKADADKLPEVQSELDSLKEAAAKNDGKNPFEDKYNQVKKEFDDFKAAAEKEKTLAAKTAAFREILKDAGITSETGVAKVLKYTDLDGWELGEDGKFKDAKEILKTVKTEWPEQITKEGVQGANTPNPPANNGGGLKTLDEIYKTDEHGRFVYDATQRQQARAEIIAAQQQKG